MLIFLFCFFTQRSVSQSFYIKKYTVLDGLPASYIISIYQDTNGFLWVGTYNGLSRFDGKEFVNYGYESGMPHIIADAIYEDKHHRLWIGTRSGMAQVRGKRCVIYPWDDHLPINFVFRFYETTTGELWALTGKGVYQFSKDHWKKIKLYPGFENHTCVNVIERDSGMLINYGHHVVLRDNRGGFRLLNQVTQDDAVGPAFLDLYLHDDLLYLNRADFLYKILGADSTVLFPTELLNKYILHTYVDSRGRHWVYTRDDQLMVSAPGDQVHFFYKKSMRLVSRFYEDRDGNVWVAGEDGLLEMKEVSYVGCQRTFNPEVSGNCSVLQTPNDLLLVSAAGNNLFTISAPGKKNDFQKTPVKQFAPHNEIIDCWCVGENGKLYLIFRNERDLFTLQNNRLQFLGGVVKGNIHPLNGVAYNLQNRKLYVCADSFECGDEKNLYFFKSANDGKLISHPTCIHYFTNGRMLVGSRNDGFFIVDEKDNIYPISEKTMRTHDSYSGIFFFDDPSGKFWITSPYGMVRYHWNKQLMPEKDLEITRRQGLPNSAVRSVVFDSLKRIWAVTLSGIVVIEIDSSKNIVHVDRLSDEQGVTSEYWTEARLARDKNGHIWAGLTDQLLKFDPSLLPVEKNPPRIAIDNVQLNSKETNWSQWTDSFAEIMEIPNHPTLPYNKNNIDIAYKGISFTSSDIEYCYRLEGVDSTWSIPTTSSFVSFVGLPPGKYTFQVRARKSDSNWSDPAAFSFAILKPFWGRWWFRLLIAAVAGGLIYTFYRYRINQLKQLFAVRTKISRDLHDEVGSTLSGIGLLSEMAKQQLENSRNIEVSTSLQKISTHSEEMLGKMSDIVWAINPQNDSFEKIIDRLKSYAKSIAASTGIHVHFETEKDLMKMNLDMQQRNNIYLICKEAINNAIKYSECRNICFELRRNDRQFQILVKDDGKGFNSQQVYEGNGLKNIRARAKEIGAGLKIHSENDAGTSITLLISFT